MLRGEGLASQADSAVGLDPSVSGLTLRRGRPCRPLLPDPVRDPEHWHADEGLTVPARGTLCRHACLCPHHPPSPRPSQEVAGGPPNGFTLTESQGDRLVALSKENGPETVTVELVAGSEVWVLDWIWGAGHKGGGRAGCLNYWPSKPHHRQPANPQTYLLSHCKRFHALQEEDEDAYTELPEDNTEQEGEEPLPYPATPFSVSVAKGDSELRCGGGSWSWGT